MSSDATNSAFTTVFDDSKQSKLNLTTYLDQYVLSENDATAENFISMAPQCRKRFYVPDDAIPQMMALLNLCHKDSVANHLYELQDLNEVEASGLVFEFKFASDQNKIEFDTVVPGFIRTLFRDILPRWIAFSDEKEEHYCFYLATVNPVYDCKSLKFKSKFRIVIPSIMLSSDVRYFVYQRVWQSLDMKLLFEKRLNYRIRDCFDRSLRMAPITLIGCCDLSQNEPLRIDSVYKVIVEDGTSTGDAMPQSSLDTKFPNLAHDVSINYPLIDGGVVEKSHYLPLDICLQKMEDDDNDRTRFQIAYDHAKAEFAKLAIVDNDIEFVYDMLDMLSDDRFADLNGWLEVIKAIASKGKKYRCVAILVTKDRAKGIVTWTDFETYWSEVINSVTRARHSAKVLRYWASCDSPSQMYRYTEETIRNMIVRDIRDPFVRGRLFHTHIAEYVYFMFKNSYVTHDVMKSIMWYEFVTPRSRDVEPGQLYKWRNIGAHPDSLSLYISKEFKALASKVHNDLKSQCAAFGSEDKDDARGKYVKSLYNSYDRSIISIFNKGFKNSVIEEASSSFKQNHFVKNLDKTPHILGVGNGVLEFDGSEARLLDYYHTYPISLYTDTNYVPYDAESPFVQTMYTMLKSLVPNDEEDALDFLLYYLSTSLDWHTKEALFLIIHGGGCHALDTPIRMFDGSIKMVQDVVIGDKLMGDDNTPRIVQELFRGTDDMFRICPVKGEPFEVNKDHVLSLKFTNVCSVQKRDDGSYVDCPKYRAVWYEMNGEQEPKKKSKTLSSKKDASEYLAELAITNKKLIQKGDIIDIKVKNLMKWSPWWLKKGNVSLYKSSGVSYESKTLAVDPYFVGYWLGDGTTRTCQFTTMDQEVIDEITASLGAGLSISKHAGNRDNKASCYRIVERGTRSNRLLDAMRSENLINNKHVPEIYKTSSEEQRLELLAGMLDADGHYNPTMNNFELTLKIEELLDDFIEVARSLGFAAYKSTVKKTATNGANGPAIGTYYRTHIYGNGIEKIPCRIARKQATPRIKEKNPLLNSFKIEAIDRDDYYGFELDGNHRYLTGDFFVHHNSNGKTVLLELFRRTLGEMYARKMPLGFITEQGRTRSSSADPSVMELKDARLVYYSESDRNEKVNVAKIKEVTGGETLSGRQLYKEQENFRANCNHIVTTNHRFVIETTEHAVWRRFISYKFKICFKHEPNEEDPLERKRDPELINRIMNDKRYQEAFLSILVHYRSVLYSRYEGQILKVPHPTIINETEEYRQSEDIFQRYIMQKVYYYKGRGQTLDDMVSDFRSYYRVENGEVYKAKTADLIHTFRNTILGPYITQAGGIYAMDDLYTCSEHESLLPGSVLFSEWIKQ